MKQLLPIICLAALLITLLFPAQDLYADNLNECLVEALKKADDSVTVGQLRKQCRKEAGSSSTSPPSQPDPAVEGRDDPNTNMMSENGPVEVILKTSKARNPAYFPHKRHQSKYTCGKCHHDRNSSGKLVKFTEKTNIYKCTACHNTDMPNEELNGFQLIGHKLCRECHRKNQDITSAKCSTCHRKNM